MWEGPSAGQITHHQQTKLEDIYDGQATETVSSGIYLSIYLLLSIVRRLESCMVIESQSALETRARARSLLQNGFEPGVIDSM